MRALVFFFCLVISTLFMLAGTAAHADSVCVNGYRDTTADERAAMTSVLENALRALPPAPEGWVLLSDERLYVKPTVCRDDEAQPWSYEFSRDYQRVDDLDQRNKILDDAAARVTAAIQAKQPRIDAVQAKIQELSTAAVAAAAKNDFARIDALNVELERATAEMERIMAEGGTLEQVDAANAEAGRDQNVRIAVSVNAAHEPLGYGADSMTAPSAAQYAYRWRETGSGASDVTALVLLGHWQVNGDAAQPVPPANAAPTAAQVISVRITADESRIQSLLDSVNFETLAAPISR